MTTTKEFHIGDILSVTSGILLSPRHVDGLYDLLGFMSGEPVMTHQLPRFARECEDSLREQFPDLAAVVVPQDMEGEEQVLFWLGSLEAEYGTRREVAPLAAEDHTSIDPISEWKMMRPDAPVVTIDTNTATLPEAISRAAETMRKFAEGMKGLEDDGEEKS